MIFYAATPRFELFRYKKKVPYINLSILKVT